MKKKKIVILLILTIILVVTSLIPMPVYAIEDDSVDGSGQRQPTSDPASVNNNLLGDVMDGADDFITQGQGQQENAINTEKLQSTINSLYQLFAGVGLVVATIVGIIIGIKLMMAASSDEKAHYKHQLIAYTIGVVVIVGAIGIWKLIVGIMNNIDPAEKAYTTPVPGLITDAGVYDTTVDQSSSDSSSSTSQGAAQGSTGTSNSGSSNGSNNSNNGNSGNSGSSSNSGNSGSSVRDRGDTLIQHDPDNYYNNEGTRNSGSSARDRGDTLIQHDPDSYYNGR